VCDQDQAMTIFRPMCWRENSRSST